MKSNKASKPKDRASLLQKMAFFTGLVIIALVYTLPMIIIGIPFLLLGVVPGLTIWGLGVAPITMLLGWYLNNDPLIKN